MNARYRNLIELLQGTLDLLILQMAMLAPAKAESGPWQLRVFQRTT